MASDARHSSTAISTAIYSADQNYQSPHQRSWRGYWTKYWCFKSHKRENRIVPAARSEGASGPVQSWPPPQALAPPSSPASFINSSAQSPASFSLSLSAVSASMCSPGPPNTMFTIGPYAHETQLVSPPVFSAFTTEPNTAPFTPPPELTHLTTPSSPDVPFAQYIRSSLIAKAAARDAISPLSTSTLASPCDTPACYTPTSGHVYIGSPVSCLISQQTLVSSSKDAASENKAFSNSSTSLSHTTSSFPTFDPFAAPAFDKVPFAALILPCDTNSRSDETPSVSKGHGDMLISETSEMVLRSEQDLDPKDDQGGFCKILSENNINPCSGLASNSNEHCRNYRGDMSNCGSIEPSDNFNIDGNRDEYCSYDAEEMHMSLSYEQTKTFNSNVVRGACYSDMEEELCIGSNQEQPEFSKNCTCTAESCSDQIEVVCVNISPEEKEVFTSNAAVATCCSNNQTTFLDQETYLILDSNRREFCIDKGEVYQNNCVSENNPWNIDDESCPSSNGGDENCQPSNNDQVNCQASNTDKKCLRDDVLHEPLKGTFSSDKPQEFSYTSNIASNDSDKNCQSSNSDQENCQASNTDEKCLQDDVLHEPERGTFSSDKPQEFSCTSNIASTQFACIGTRERNDFEIEEVG